MSDEYSGEDRRKPENRRLAEEDRREIEKLNSKTQATHESVLLIVNNFTNFTDQFKSYALAEEKRFKDHTDNDDKHFNRLYGMVGKLRWYVAMGVGGIAAIEIYNKLIK